MKRKRNIPWIHRYSRSIMAGIATIGAVITAYLTVVKLTEGTAACPTKGCDIVLASPYANLFGLPLALFGFMGYASMIIFAFAPLLFNSVEQKKLRSNLDKWTGLLLFMGGTAMTIFSGYLMYLLAFEIKAACLYCIVSALCSVSLFILSIIGRDWEDIGQLFFTGAIVAILVLLYTKLDKIGRFIELSGRSRVSESQYRTVIYGWDRCRSCPEKRTDFTSVAYFRIAK
jgi:uncharacterized membrane protein